MVPSGYTVGHTELKITPQIITKLHYKNYDSWLVILHGTLNNWNIKISLHDEKKNSLLFRGHVPYWAIQNWIPKGRATGDLSWRFRCGDHLEEEK